MDRGGFKTFTKPFGCLADCKAQTIKVENQASVIISDNSDTECLPPEG